MKKIKETILSELKRMLEIDGEDQPTNDQILSNIGNVFDAAIEERMKDLESASEKDKKRYEFLEKLLVERRDMVSKLYMERDVAGKVQMTEAINSIDRTIEKWR